MKKLVVYYSLEGSTKLVADKIQSHVDGDILRLVPKKDTPKGNFKKYLWGGKSVMFGEKPKLEEYPFQVDDYDVIILGTPIWASTFTPPIKTFLAENKIKGKKVYLFACHLGGGAEKCFTKLTEALEGNDIEGTIDFLDPLKNNNIDMDEKIVGFCEKIMDK